MARGRDDQSAEPDDELEVESEEHTSILQEASLEQRAWLDSVVALITRECASPGDYLSRMAENLTQAIGEHGRVRGLIGFLASDGAHYAWPLCRTDPSRSICLSLVREVLSDREAAWRS